MNKELNKLCEELTKDIKDAYESGTTLESAERLAAKFLYGQIQVAEELKNVDLDSRMKKSGVKAVRAALYMEHATKCEKKPTEAMLAATVDKENIITELQDKFDTAEVERQALENYFNIFQNSHIYFRGIAKGRFE